MTCLSATLIASQLRSRFLEGLAPADLNCILEAAVPRRIPANAIVTNQADPADRVFLLTTGRARFFLIGGDGRKILLHWLVPGEIFGNQTLLSTPSTYIVSTETVKDSSVFAWDRLTIRDLMARYPQLADNALAIASDYLTLEVVSRIALTCDDARQRLARVITTLALSIGEKAPGGIELDATNEELASAANVTLFTTSRLLSEWQRRGAVHKSRGKLLLCSPELLVSTD
jgi:CRP-like cAMP-binding protein